MFLVLTFAVLQGIVFALFCSYVAGQKNRSKASWFWLGFFFSFLALIALAAVPSISRRNYMHAINYANQNRSETKKCPFCAEEIQRDAIVCRFCQRDMPPSALKIEAESKAAAQEVPSALQADMEKYGIHMSKDGSGYVYLGRHFSHYSDAIVLAKSKSALKS